MRRQAARHAARHILHEGRIGKHEPFASMRIAAVLVATPHLLQLYGFYVGLQDQPLGSRSWVGQRVHLFEPARLYPSVCLGRADCCVAKKFLNCPQISTSLEQMSSK